MTRQTIILITVAVCCVAILHLIEWDDWNAAGLLTLAVAIFLLDRAAMWEHDQEEDDHEQD